MEVHCEGVLAVGTRKSKSQVGLVHAAMLLLKRNLHLIKSCSIPKLLHLPLTEVFLPYVFCGKEAYSLFSLDESLGMCVMKSVFVILRGEAKAKGGKALK